MTGLHERILAAVHQLGAERPPDTVSLADVARAAGVSWPTVRRHVGGKAHLRELLTRDRPETAPPATDTRRRIQAAASHVFARSGYNGATLDHVARAAGVTKGAVYWHFANKGDLFLALIEERIAEQARTLPGMVQSIDSVDGLAAVLTRLFADLKAE
jgi:AcrR family transcriptional regulator